jgi:hypothetical protein
MADLKTLLSTTPRRRNLAILGAIAVAACCSRCWRWICRQSETAPRITNPESLLPRPRLACVREIAHIRIVSKRRSFDVVFKP